MFLPFALLTLLLPALSLATTSPPQQQPQSPPLYTATLHHLPVTTSPPSSLLSSSKETPKPLAILTYHPHHPHLSRLLSFTPPANSTNPNDLTQIAIYLPNGDTGSGRVRTSATATYAFHSPYRGRFRIVVDPITGNIMAASYNAHLPLSHLSSQSQSKPTTNSKGSAKEVGGRGDFDIQPMSRAPAIVFDKPAKGKGSSNPFSSGTGSSGATATEEEEPAEKTFLQKYWWLLIGVAVLAMSGGGGEK